jgi:glycosyltransferase involved in cell wall biosynthesis
MRVLHVTPDLSPALGGTTTAALELSAALARRGADVTLISTNLNEVGRWRPLYRPKTLPGLNSLSDGYKTHLFAARWPTRFGYCPDMHAYLRANVALFDVVHLHRLYRFSTVVGAQQASRVGVPYVISPHGVLLPYHRRRRWLRKKAYDLVQRKILDNAFAVHYTSDYELQAAQTLGLSPRPVLIRVGINPDNFAHLPAKGGFRARHPELSGKRLVVFLGRLAPQKGLDLLVDAFAGVAKTLDSAHLVIAGPDAEGYGGTVRGWLQKKNLLDRATMVGPVYGNEKLELMVDTDVWVLPSYAENFGIAVVEALACRLPVVISDRIGVHKEIVAAHAGIVVRCDRKEFTQAILGILADSSKARFFGESGFRLATTQFTWMSTASRMLDLYSEVAKAGHHASIA